MKVCEMMNLQATKLARKIIRDSKGLKFGLIYTNKYKNCRTVKCYWFKDVSIDTISHNIAASIPGATVKLRPNSSWWGSQSSLIVRIPLAEGDA